MAQNPGVGLRGALEARLSAYFRGNSLFLLARCNLTLVQWATACKLVRKLEKRNTAPGLGAHLPLPKLGLLACSLVLALGERPLRLGHRLSSFSWSCGILALTLQQPILTSYNFCRFSLENKPMQSDPEKNSNNF